MAAIAPLLVMFVILFLIFKLKVERLQKEVSNCSLVPASFWSLAGSKPRTQPMRVRTRRRAYNYLLSPPCAVHAREA
jgi:hypothetical protein